MSDTDKKDSLGKELEKAEKCFLENGEFNDEIALKYFKKIRLKILRKLIILKWHNMNWYFHPEHYEHHPLTIEGIQDILKGTKRDAYDYFYTMVILLKISDLSDTGFYQFLPKAVKLDEEMKQNK